MVRLKKTGARKLIGISKNVLNDQVLQEKWQYVLKGFVYLDDAQPRDDISRANYAKGEMFYLHHSWQ